ncbi:MAG: hypothetical protein K8R60_09400 [Burkholderiales bacterium]|nr:hypothetical protein [Burkholderiales bacterium]
MKQQRRSFAQGFALALMLGLAAPISAQADGCVPQITLTEQVQGQPGGSVLGQYVMTTGDLCGLQIVALAVDNDDSLSAFSSLSGWNSLVVTDNFWDSGIVLSRDDFGTGSSYQVLTGPAGIGSFLSFFGPFAELANLYWLSAHYGGPVVDNSTAFTAVGTPIALPEDAFQFQARAPASQPVFFLFDPSANTTVAISAVVSAVPEPAETLLLAMGLLVMMARTRLARAKTAG